MVVSSPARALVLVVAVAVGSGCSSPATELLVVTRLASDAGAPPSVVNVAVFDDFGRIGRARVVPATLPGALVITLPPVERDLRVVVVSESTPPQLGYARARTVPNRRTTAELLLRRDLADGDGDGVPDDVDDCPSVRDPEQTNAAGTGPGDACHATADLSTPVDLGPPPADLAAPADLLPPPSLCPTSTAVLCDSFESGAPLAAWSKNQNRGSVTVETTRAYRGTRSLHAHHDALTAGQEAQGLLFIQSFPQPDVWVRAFVYVPSGFPTATVSLVGGQQSTTPYQGAYLNLANGVFVGYNDLSGSAVLRTTTTAIPTNRWVCVEWALRIGATGSMRASIDGTAIAELTPTQSTSATPPIGTLFVGLNAPIGGAVAARDLWLDEIVIDNKAIGCAQ